MKVIISTSSINSYGGRVLTSGIDFSQFKKNPLLLYMHMRADEIGRLGGKNPVLGTVENIKVEGDNLVGEMKFSETNPFAQEVKALYEENTLKMVSAGLKSIEWSDDPATLLPGQNYSTLTKSKLREVSCCDLGSNDDSLRLYDENDKIIELNAGDINAFPPIRMNADSINKNKLEMKEVLGILNLKDDTDESGVVASIKELQLRAARADELEAKIKEDAEKVVLSLVEKAVVDKKITADKKEIFLSIGRSAGIEALNASLEAINPVVDVAGAILRGQTNAKIELTAEKWDELDRSKGDDMAKLKSEDPETYKALYRAKYGKEYKQQ